MDTFPVVSPLFLPNGVGADLTALSVRSSGLVVCAAVLYFKVFADSFKKQPPRTNIGRILVNKYFRFGTSLKITK